jgi:hypothetical protein
MACNNNDVTLIPGKKESGANRKITFAFFGRSKMPTKKSGEEHLQYLELDQDSIFELRKVKDILEPAMDEMLNNLYAHILEEPVLDSLSCDKLEIDQTRSVCATLSPC